MTHFRHGARAPQIFYNKEKYLDYALEYWNTPGELTPAGQRMHYLLGIRNRIRYIIDGKFLKDKFESIIERFEIKMEPGKLEDIITIKIKK